MKKILMIAAICLATLQTGNIYAQHHDSSSFKKNMKKGADGVKKGATAVGNKTAEVAVKGTSAVTDNVYKDKVAAGGQTVYIDNKSRYYYVNEKGAKVYVTKASLKDK